MIAVHVKEMSRERRIDFYAVTDRNVYAVTLSSIERTDLPRRTMNLMREGFENKAILEVREALPGFVVLLEDGAMVSFDAVYDPVDEISWPTVIFCTKEEAAEWENEYLEMPCWVPNL